jgi:HEAT repeat protein
VGALADPNLFVRWAAARTLGEFAPRAAGQAVPALARLLRPEEDLSVRLAVATALAKYGPNAKAAVPTLARTIAQGAAEVRIVSLKALESIGTDAAPALPAIAGRLRDGDFQVRAEAARVLGRFGSLAAETVPALRSALFDSNEEVRRAASDAILAIESKK